MDVGADAELDKVDGNLRGANSSGNIGAVSRSGNWGQTTRQHSVCRGLSLGSQGRGRVQDGSWVIVSQSLDLRSQEVLSSGTLVVKRKSWTKVKWFAVFVSVSFSFLGACKGPVVSMSPESFSFVGACKGPVGSHLFLVTVKCPVVSSIA
ncbi:hypothetical protein EV363DRAFT_1170824 [Boletus edulis]|nr:hypothetical protein EV363DRAFT_1170824 [Boletus edulis]